MKKNFQPPFLFAFSAIVLCTISCKKSDDPKTKTELLTQGSWKYSSATAGGASADAWVDACYKDNLITFNATGETGNVNESSTVCSPSTAGNFTWAFKNNETEMTVTANLFPGGSGDISIVSLTETTLVVSQDMTIPPYPTTNVTVTLTH